MGKYLLLWVLFCILKETGKDGQLFNIDLKISRFFIITWTDSFIYWNAKDNPLLSLRSDKGKFMKIKYHGGVLYIH